MRLTYHGRSVGLVAVLTLLVVVPFAWGCAGRGPTLNPAGNHHRSLYGQPCGNGELPTAGNLTAWFLGNVQQGRDPIIQGGVDDPFGCAYEQLCAQIRSTVSEADFRSSRAEAVSKMLSADTWAGARSGPFEYKPGVDVERPDMDTLDPEVTSTWEDMEVTWFEHIDDRTIVENSGHTERWRISLVREHGNWRVCGFDLRESDPHRKTNGTSTTEHEPTTSASPVPPTQRNGH